MIDLTEHEMEILSAIKRGEDVEILSSATWRRWNGGDVDDRERLALWVMSEGPSYDFRLPPKPKVSYVNVYPGSLPNVCNAHATKGAADAACAGGKRTGCLKLTLTNGKLSVEVIGE